MMDITVDWWAVTVVLGLAACGFLAVCWVVSGWAEHAADWLRDRRDARESGVPASGFRRLREWTRDRVIPLLEDMEGTGVLCAGCAGFEHCDGQEGACDCTCGWSEDWAEDELPPPLPPERTWEQMTSHQLPLTRIGEDMSWWTPQRERRAPWWEAEHRAAYESLGFDYPSGLMARVRELTP